MTSLVVRHTRPQRRAASWLLVVLLPLLTAWLGLLAGLRHPQAEALAILLGVLRCGAPAPDTRGDCTAECLVAGAAGHHARPRCGGQPELGWRADFIQPAGTWRRLDALRAGPKNHLVAAVSPA